MLNASLYRVSIHTRRSKKPKEIVSNWHNCYLKCNSDYVAKELYRWADQDHFDQITDDNFLWFETLKSSSSDRRRLPFMMVYAEFTQIHRKFKWVYWFMMTAKRFDSPKCVPISWSEKNAKMSKNSNLMGFTSEASMFYPIIMLFLVSFGAV